VGPEIKSPSYVLLLKSVEKLFMTRNKSSAAHATRMAFVTVGAPATDALDFLKRVLANLLGISTA